MDGKKFGTKKMPCDCVNEFQDKQYGKGIRIHNLCKGGEQARCTGCAKTKSAR